MTIITIAGTYCLNKQQSATRSTQLNSQFMSEREKAENQVRKDMFEKVLAEFWHRPDEKRCILDEIDQQLLQLELISRNFHETLDLSPLFTHVLLKIGRNINTATLKFPMEQAALLEGDSKKIKIEDACSKKAYRRLLSRNNKLFNTELLGFWMGKYGDHFEGWKRDSCKKEDAQTCKYKYIIWRYIRDTRNYKKQQLVNIARRITAKQMESLSDAVKRVRLRVDLKKTCIDTKPNRKFVDSEICYEFQDQKKKMGVLIEQVAEIESATGGEDKVYSKCTIAYSVDKDKAGAGPVLRKGIKLMLDNKTGRCFRFSVRRTYPAWNSVFVEVTTNKHAEEIQADRLGGNADKAGFWVSFFDFPLADNTYLSNKERFAVVLEDLDEDTQTADLSLLYFPASYAGFKEKAFYQQRMINTLLKGN